MDNLNYPAVVPVEIPVGLTHLASDLSSAEVCTVSLSAGPEGF